MNVAEVSREKELALSALACFGIRQATIGSRLFGADGLSLLAVKTDFARLSLTTDRNTIPFSAAVEQTGTRPR
jgi:hypothetical protein